MIITFYSYKGGVGRTQLLANLAAYYCFYENKKILLIDWDLEAPGLHFYFAKDTLQNKGLIELFSDYCDLMSARLGGSIPENEIQARFKDNLAQYIVSNVTQSKEGRIDLMTAGFYDDNYTKLTNNFDWVRFYENLDGGFFIELLKTYLKDLDYDYIFIDSRTGVSDYSGICNVQIPDANVLVVAPTRQNVQGSLRVARTISEAPYIVQHQRRFPIIFPILSRLDPLDDHQKAKWIKGFREDFNMVITQLLRLGTLNGQITPSNLATGIENYISDTMLEYKTDLSYGEQLLFSNEQAKMEKTTLAYQITRIAYWINCYAPHPNVALLPFDIAKPAGVMRFDAIKQRFERWTKANPDGRNLFNYAVFLHEEGRYDLALKQYLLAKNYISAPEQTMKLNNNLALIYKNQQQYDKAQILFEAILHTHPQNADVWFNVADVWWEQGNVTKANECYTHALECYQAQTLTLTIQQKIAQTYLNQAACYMQLEEWDKAETACIAALEQYRQLPNPSKEALRKLEDNLAITLLQQKKYAETLQYGETLSKYAVALNKQINSYDPDFYIARAKRLNEQEEYEAVIRECNEVLLLDPHNTEAYCNRGLAYNGLKQYDKAIADYNKAIALDPNNVKVYNNRGNVYHDLKQYDKAIADYNKAIELDPNFAYTYGNRGTAYNELKQYDKAITDYTKAIALDPNNANAYGNRGLAYNGLKQYDKAIVAYNKAIALDPNNANAYNNRGNAYNELKQYDKAIADYNKAIELDPNYVYTYYNRGLAYHNLEEHPQAIADYKKALSLLPPTDSYYPIIQKNLQEAQFLLNKP